MKNGTKIKIVENLEEVYKMRGWSYIPESHNQILGKTAVVTSIEEKYSHDYIMSIKIDDGTNYNGTLPVQGVIII